MVNKIHCLFTLCINVSSDTYIESLLNNNKNDYFFNLFSLSFGSLLWFVYFVKNLFEFKFISILNLYILSINRYDVLSITVYILAIYKVAKK